MTTDHIPFKLIDREVEKALFKELLQRENSARILTILASGGEGKSFLLNYYQHYCRTVARIPVCSINFGMLMDGSPWTFVKHVVQELRSSSFEFQTFELIERARLSNDFSIDSISKLGLQPEQSLSVTKVLRALNSITVAPHRESRVSQEQQIMARQISVEAFLKDLRRYSNQQPIVLLLDEYEKVSMEFREWFFRDFLEPIFFNPASLSGNLLLVIAGREAPDFEAHWPPEDCKAIVQSVRGLSNWSKEHLVEFLQVHGYEFTPAELSTFYQLLKMDYTLFEVINLVETRDRRRLQ